MSSIYFLLCREAGAVKVGWARNIDRRLAELQCGCPFDLELIGSVAGSRLDEARAHDALFHGFLRGEWFTESSAREFLNRATVDGLQAVLAEFEAGLDRRRTQIENDVAAAMAIIAYDAPTGIRPRDMSAYIAERSVRDHDFLNRWLAPLGMVFDGRRVVQMAVAA